jgi:hypothetical protein
MQLWDNYLKFMSRLRVKIAFLEKLNKNGRQSFDYLSLSTHDDSVLELFYKDLYQLYNLKNTLEAEGLDNYVIDYHRTERTNSNSLLH